MQDFQRGRFETRSGHITFSWQQERSLALASAILLLLGIIFLQATGAKAQETSILSRGDAVVTGFSGVKAPDAFVPLGTDPLDVLHIDLDGPSVQIFKLDVPGASPQGQLVAHPATHKVLARDVGQVFPIALDDNAPPNIYLGQSSAFGIQIVGPDDDGDGRPDRLKKGQPDAQWMPGQFGTSKGGSPGSIYRVDGQTGAVTLFSTILGNSGAGLGDIVFDRASRHFFVSDLDTGMIHRLDETGAVIDSFDHGVRGRVAAGLPPVGDDGVPMDIKDAGFSIEDTETWGFAAQERRVWGLGLNAGRLYYAVTAGPGIWSVSINLDGAFGNDPRIEIAVLDSPGNHPISDIAFDNAGYLYIAQRGGVRGSYDYSVFADAKQSSVFRFQREIPDDPATPGLWVPIPDEYAIGLPSDHRNTSGGLALGYGYDPAGAIRPGACDTMIWSTGDRLRDASALTAHPPLGGPAVVHGLQGGDRALVRPDNEPPFDTYFIDYDGVFEDPEKQGHVGDVEIWQPCERSADFGTYTPVPYVLPSDVPPAYVPPTTVPPDAPPAWDFNLRLGKKAVPDTCVAGGFGFLCDYVVRVTNTGPDAYVGPIVVNDKLPATPAGAVMIPSNVPAWFCLAISATEQQCTYGAAALLPGDSIDLHVTVDLPVAAPVCHLDNLARIDWPMGLGDANPTDDFDLATAAIPAAHCQPPAGENTNLKIEKLALEDVCKENFGGFECRYLVTVRNIGPGDYHGPVTVDESIPPGATATFGPAALWTCQGAYTCKTVPVTLKPNQFVLLHAVVKVPKNFAAPLGCTATNKVKIVEAAGGTDQNTDPTDDDAEAKALLPGELVQCPGQPGLSNLKLRKTGPDEKCPVSGSNWVCKFTVTVQNFGDAYTSPIQFVDALPFGTPAGATVTFQPPAGWNCGGPALLPNLYQCSSNNPNLAHLESVDIPVTVKVPVAPVAKCEITNNAQIVKAPGGTLLNSFAGDDASSATAQLAPVFPQGGGQGICLSGNLRLEKIDRNAPAFGGFCPVSGGNWVCHFRLVVKNIGDPYNGEIIIWDSPVGAPAGATVTFQEPPGWQCGELHPKLFYCRTKNPKLGKGESVIIPGAIKIPLGHQEKCEVTNNARIMKAPGGSPQNAIAADDFDTVTMKLKTDVPLPDGGVACSTKRSRLKIEKTPNTTWAPGGICPVSGNVWVCEWRIKITNFGDTYTSSIAFSDRLEGVQPAGADLRLGQPVGWECKQLAPDYSACRSENPNLKDGESVEFTAIVRIPLGPVATCAVTNNARISSLGGVPNLSFGESDHSSSSTLMLNSHYLGYGHYACLAPAVGEPDPSLSTPEKTETNLAITKRAGNCDTTTAGQKCPFTITVTNEGPGVYKGPIVIEETLPVEPSDGSWSAPWTCEGQGGALGQPEKALCTHPPVELAEGKGVELMLEVELPNSYIASSGSSAKCGFMNQVKIMKALGGSELNIDPADDTAEAKAEFEPFEVHGTKFCGPEEPECPPGFQWNGEECERSGSTPPPPPGRPETPDVDEDCPQGYVGTPPNCLRIVQPDPDPVCTGGRILRNGECVCTYGREWNGQRCVRPPQQCTGGRVLRNGECVCRRGREWNGQRCVRPPQQCTGGRILRNGECVCRRGRVWNGSRCVRQVQCTGGRILRNGECVCRRGRVWNGSRCVRAPVLRPRPKLRVPETRPTPKLRIRPRLLNPDQGNNIR
jgi:hypothetical protein